MPQPGTGSHGLFEEFQLGSFPQPARSIQWQFPLHPPEVAPERPRTVGDMKAWRHRPLHPHTASKHTKLQRACWVTKRRSCGCRFFFLSLQNVLDALNPIRRCPWDAYTPVKKRCDPSAPPEPQRDRHACQSKFLISSCTSARACTGAF